MNTVSWQDTELRNISATETYIIVDTNIFGCRMQNEIGTQNKGLLVQRYCKGSIHAYNSSFSVAQFANQFYVDTPQKRICWWLGKKKSNLYLSNSSQSEASECPRTRNEEESGHMLDNIGSNLHHYNIGSNLLHSFPMQIPRHPHLQDRWQWPGENSLTYIHWESIRNHTISYPATSNCNANKKQPAGNVF